MSGNWKCKKCGAILYNVVGKLGKCPICGHCYEPSAYGKEKCDCKYCRSRKSPKMIDKEVKGR